MKSLFVLILLSSLLMLSYGREEPHGGAEEYWKKVMKKQEMPKALSDLLKQEAASAKATKTERFVMDFDVKHNAILYHTHSDESKKQTSPNLN